MSFREPAETEKNYSRIQGIRDEMRLLNVARDKILAGRLTNAYDAVSAMLRVTAILTSLIGEPIYGLDVTLKFEQMQHNFESSMWFEETPGVEYDGRNNRVTILPEYWKRYGDLTEDSLDFVQFRVSGMPGYRMMVEVFNEGWVGTIDMQWVISRLDGGHPKWMRTPIVYGWW